MYECYVYLTPPPPPPPPLPPSGVPLPPIQRRAQHRGAGDLPGRARPGQGGSGAGPGGAEEDPRLPGPVPSSVPQRAEPAAPHGFQRGHGAHGGLDLRNPQLGFSIAAVRWSALN